MFVLGIIGYNVTPSFIYAISQFCSMQDTISTWGVPNKHIHK